MRIHRIDPLRDPRWEEFIQSHPEASIFHTPAWLQALNRTYGYEPVAFTTADPNAAIGAGVVCCRVRSILTGSRLVSVPFADHCQPLASTSEEIGSILTELERCIREESLKYIEVRWRRPQIISLEVNCELSISKSFAFHVLDLKPDLHTLFGRFHRNCVQRKIRRAEREALRYEESTSDKAIRQFYALLGMTRRRHGLPPQPLEWFFNLRNAWGEALKVRTAFKDILPIASILTIGYKKTLVYKYGCSDSSFHNLGAMPFLFWQSIQDAKRLGASELDLGRSDLDNPGLIAFKEHLGATPSTVNYYRYPAAAAHERGLPGASFRSMIYRYLPDSALRIAGRLLYRHVG